jgi:hypothetical protein
VELAEVALLKKWVAAAARLYADGFARDAALAGNLRAGHRYDAACAAALAASGQGQDAARLDDRELARLRRQALDWLRADLDAWAKQLASGRPDDRAAVRKTMLHWRHDPDLAGLRDAAALGKLPADERAAWHKLWEDVRELHAKAAARE